MCSFCKIGEYSRGDYKIGQGYAPMVFISKENEKYILKCIGDDDTEIEITFCPICGAKLR